MAGSRDYHDYFIKDGRFIGAFEEMYQNVPDPWHIDALGRRLDMDAALLLVTRQNRKFPRVLDVGCGKGFFSSLLADAAKGVVWAGDVSPTAIQDAAQRLPREDIHFFVLDLSQPGGMPAQPERFDLIVMAQTIWCVLPHLDRVLADFRDRLDPKGGVLISQHFPGPQNQKYGRDILCDPEGLYEFLDRAGFQVAETLETNRHKNHHVAVWAEPKRPEAEP